MDWVPPLSLALLLVMTLAQTRRPLEGKSFLYLRSLFPSWRFFEDAEAGPTLWFCVESSEAPEAPWQPALLSRTASGFWLNAEGNLLLAQQSLVEQLLSELDGVREDVAPTLTAYRLIQRLVEETARKSRTSSAPVRYRFRLCSGDEVEFESESHLL